MFLIAPGGEALWTESQTVAIDSAGHYKVQLGATSPNGLPAGLFSTGEARWLEVQIAGEAAQSRVLLASVPYALKAGDATTLGGLPAWRGEDGLRRSERGWGHTCGTVLHRST